MGSSSSSESTATNTTTTTNLTTNSEQTVQTLEQRKISFQSFNTVIYAIDLGTSRSGACFTLPHDPERLLSGIPNKDQVVKVPTDILIDLRTRNLVASGENAIQRYHTEEKASEKYVLFEKFKMQLYRENKILTERPTVKSVCGTVEIGVVDAFAYVFQYFRKCAVEILATNAKSYKMSDIEWMITVPAIWSDGAKQIMMEAAKKGGLANDDSRITVCLEPTAAAMWAIHTLCKQDTNLVPQGTKYLTLDAGGGTIDIMLAEVLANNELKKLAPESGGGWGSTYIDKEFENMLDDVFEKVPMDDFRKSKPSEYHEMMTAFESVKEILSLDDVKTSKAFSISIAEFSIFMKEKHKIDAEKRVKEKGAAFGLSYYSLKLKIPVITMMQFFKKQVDRTVDHLKKLLGGHNDVKFIYMVGGFSCSNIFYDEIKKEFEDSKKYRELRVVRPPHPGEAIMMGAVLHGRKLSTITNIIKDVSYGVGMNSAFDPTKHDPSKKYFDPYDGFDRAKDCFDMYLKKGESRPAGYSLKVSYIPYSPRDTEASFQIFVSESENPIHTTEPSCHKIGVVNLPIPIPDDMKIATDKELRNRKMEVELKFQKDRLIVTATYPLTGEKRSVDIDYFLKR